MFNSAPLLVGARSLSFKVKVKLTQGEGEVCVDFSPVSERHTEDARLFCSSSQALALHSSSVTLSPADGSKSSNVSDLRLARGGCSESMDADQPIADVGEYADDIIDAPVACINVLATAGSVHEKHRHVNCTG
jgi:hypothetical protein